MPFAVGLAHAFRFLGDVERIGGGELHAVGGLHRCDAALKRGIWSALLGEVFAVERLHEVKLAALRGGIEFGIAQPRNHFLRRNLRVIDVHALMLRGQEGAVPQD